MEYLELLFAVEVRKLAVKMAEIEHDRVKDELEGDLEADAKLAEWEAAHTTADDFLEEAYLKIVGTAKQIETFEKARINRVLEGSKFAPRRPPPTVA